MLQKLTIRNYALIDSVDLELDKGLNIITGETGAGKSIMLGALSLILGQRAETRYFYNQDKKCIIEGQFTLSDNSLKVFFEENDIDFYQETTLRREISTDGKSRAFINDTPVTLTVMKATGERLIDIHSQHATLEINDPAFQLSVIDTVANHGLLLTDYRNLFKSFKKAQQQLTLIKTDADEARKKQDYEQFLFNELEAAALKEDEQEKLEAELELLDNSENIKRNLLNAAQLIDDQESAATTLLKEGANQLQAIGGFSADYQTLNERLRSVLIEVKDIAAEINALEEEIVFNPTRISELNSRLDTINALQQKHKVNTNRELIEVKEKLSDSLNALLNSDETIVKLERELIEMSSKLEKMSSTLSANRKQSIKKTEEQVIAILTNAGMPNARIKLEQQPLLEFNKDGKDAINLLFSANSGQPPAPVAKVASGGELSRLMLSIKSILAKHTSLPTLIFDEIDTGISGETAVRVGNVIGDLALNMQVICITHLPQIAAKGQSHYFVYKQEGNERTTTGIKKLKANERVAVIAEMLSGKNPGESALQNAKELLTAN
ncbi:DNA repair protein RecN [Pedobacter sp. PWIIR3]